MATMLGPRLRRLWVRRASTSTVSLSGARACWIAPKLRLCPQSTRPVPMINTNGPVTSRGSTVVIVLRNQLRVSRIQ